MIGYYCSRLLCSNHQSEPERIDIYTVYFHWLDQGRSHSDWRGSFGNYGSAWVNVNPCPGVSSVREQWPKQKHHSLASVVTMHSIWGYPSGIYKFVDLKSRKSGWDIYIHSVHTYSEWWLVPGPPILNRIIVGSLSPSHWFRLTNLPRMFFLRIYLQLGLVMFWNESIFYSCDRKLYFPLTLPQ